MIDFQIDAEQIEQAALNVGATEEQARKALRSTLNKMAAWMRTRSTKGLSKELQIQQRIIRRRLKAVKFRDTPDGGVAKVWFGLNPINLIWLGARQTGAGVIADGGRFAPGAFIATMRNGHKGVYKRRGRKRLPIDEQADYIQTPAERYISQMTVFSTMFQVQFWKTFEHELKWRTQ